MMKKILFLAIAGLCLSLVGTTAYGQGNDAYTVLLLHCNGEDGSLDFVDESSFGHHTVTAYGDARIDTAQYKFGTASGLFERDGDYLSIPDSDDWNFGSGDFSIDFWIRFSDFGARHRGIMIQGTPLLYWEILYNKEENKIKLVTNTWKEYSGNEVEAFWNASLNIWYHVAITRSGNQFRWFINGVKIVRTLKRTEAMPDCTGSLDVSGDSAVYGWLDEIRISKGIARWKSEFSPPKEEYYASSHFAYAGEDQVVEEKQLVTLDGSGSFVLGGNIAYHWDQISGPPVVLSDETSVNPTFSAPVVDADTDLEFELVLTDIDTGQQSKPDYVTITVPYVYIEEEQVLAAEEEGPSGSVLWKYVTNEQGEARPVVRVILLAILATFYFIYVKKRVKKS